LHGGGGQVHRVGQAAFAVAWVGISAWMVMNQVPGLVHAIFAGQDGGQALAEVLFGDVNLSGKLPFTFEKRFQDNPAHSNYPNDLSVTPPATPPSTGKASLRAIAVLRKMISNRSLNSVSGYLTRHSHTRISSLSLLSLRQTIAIRMVTARSTAS
jgi:hypothetical protein